MTSDEKTLEHWADRAAAEILATRGDEHVVATGISPSGPFHVGHLREILTGDAIHRALLDRGARSRLVFIVDNLDPLRKVYPFLDPAVYEELVGRSLCEIPAPGGAEGRYDEHFLRPFLAALELLRVDAEVLPASELYATGAMDDVVFTALERRDRIAAILAEVTGKEVGADWSPWNPRDPETGRISQVEVLGFDRDSGLIRFRRGPEASVREQPITGGGKLTWRIDWPARWKALGVTVEPFGKDHASRGGSYDSGMRVARDVFDAEAPYPLVYEWIALKGQGDMSASKGNVLEPHVLLETVPPEVLRYFVIKAKPKRSLRFDPGLALLRLVDEVDDAHARGRDERSLELSRAAGFEPVGVPFKHLTLVGQIAGFELDRVLEILGQGGYENLSRSAVERRLEMARRWLERFAPEEAKVEVAETLPAGAAALSPEQKAFLGRVADELPSLADPEEIHNAIHAQATGEGGPGARRGFEAVYRVLIDRDRGPRAGSFIAFLGRERVAARFAEASQA